MLVLGLWTTSFKKIAIENIKKSKISYLPTIPKSPEDPVWKTYLNFLLDTI